MLQRKDRTDQAYVRSYFLGWIIRANHFSWTRSTSYCAWHHKRRWHLSARSRFRKRSLPKRSRQIPLRSILPSSRATVRGI